MPDGAGAPGEGAKGLGFQAVMLQALRRPTGVRRQSGHQGAQVGRGRSASMWPLLAGWSEVLGTQRLLQTGESAVGPVGAAGGTWGCHPRDDCTATPTRSVPLRK